MLVGDSSVGKTCLIRNYLYNEFSDDYEPTVLDVFTGSKNVSKQTVDVEIHDTSGDEHLGTNRKIQYVGSDCFMICVAANYMVSYENIKNWLLEIQEVSSSKPIMLIQTKKDLIDKGLVEEEQMVTLKMLRKKSTKLNLQGAMATSSKEWKDFNVHKAFNKVLHLAYIMKYGPEDDD